MTKRYKVLLPYCILLVVLIPLLIIGCRKSDRDEDSETLSARDNALAYHIFDDVWREVHRVAMQDTLLGYYDTNLIWRPNQCIQFLTISDTVPVFPLDLIINYSDDGEICNDGFFRYGVIAATFSARYISAGAEIVIGLDGYRKDRFDVEGSITVTNIGTEDDQMQFLIEVEDGRITGNNIDIEWEGTHTYTWIQGNSTFSSIFDDIFTIEGTASGKNSRGVEFVNEITSNYRADLSCQWFTSGRSKLEVENLATRFINYDNAGMQDCNNLLVARRFNTYPVVSIPY